MIIAGDFNTSMNPKLDLDNNLGSNHVKKREIIQEFMEQKSLVDIWRVRNPEEMKFTWKKVQSGQLIMSRLDYFLVSSDIALCTKDAQIKPGYKSDHSRIALQLDLSSVQRGKGFWKFNNMHLKDKKFLNMMNETITKFKYEVKNIQNSPLETQWMQLKNSMIGVAKSFSINKAKAKNSLIENFEMRLINLDKKYLNSRNAEERKQILNKIKKTEDFLMYEHEDKVKAAMFRSKCTYYQYGEKNSRYFFNLEKTRSGAKIITRLQNDSALVINDPGEILREEKLYYQKLNLLVNGLIVITPTVGYPNQKERN